MSMAMASSAPSTGRWSGSRAVADSRAGCPSTIDRRGARHHDDKISVPRPGPALPRTRLMWRTIPAVVALILGSAASTRAEFVVRIEDRLVPAGGTASLDVFVSSTNPNGDPLASFGFEFLITPTGPRRLEFVSPQSD